MSSIEHRKYNFQMKLVKNSHIRYTLRKIKMFNMKTIFTVLVRIRGGYTELHTNVDGQVLGKHAKGATTIGFAATYQVCQTLELPGCPEDAHTQ